MKDDSNPIARLTYTAGLIAEALLIVDADGEHLAGARLDEALAIVRDRIAELKGRAS